MADNIERSPPKLTRRRPPRMNGGPKAVKTKQQKIYARLSETVPVNADLKAFLQHRMGRNVVHFEIIEGPGKVSDNGDENVGTRVVLLFQSKSAASKAVHYLHTSNRHTNSKIHCFYTSAQEKGIKVEKKEHLENRYDKHMREIYEAAKSALDFHESKIREANGNLESITDKLAQQRALSLDEHEKLVNEKNAREDKLDELNQQRKEFKLFLTNLKKRLDIIKFDDNFEVKIQELRKNLGVECNRLRSALPMYARRSDILDVIKKHQVCVILGETGSGKSTQMTQYIYQAGFANTGMIACTQPRKIAAVSLATHVASEMACSVGQVVGYQVGMQKRKSGVTKVLYMTDHVLLNECLKDNNLSEYSCLIIDEAHERSIYTDLLLGMIKQCLRNRPDLKVIVTSATIDPSVFVAYFGGEDFCPVLQVSGRTFPVTVFYNGEDEEQQFPEQHEDKAVNKAVEIHRQFPVDDGDILVFLTSPLEIEKSCERFQNTVSEKNFKCMQLHGKLQAEEQKLVFEPPPRGHRKIVFATNSAETSITIPGIKFVIDTGVAKEMRYDPKRNINSLSIFPVSKSSAEQRKGRAGRMAPGKCYRLYSEKDFNEMEACTKPEILRVHLGQALLKLLDLGVNPLEFDFVESPPKTSLHTAMESLADIQAVKDSGITNLGRWIAKLPLEPRLGVLVKQGINKGMPIETMVIAACCGSSGIFYRAGTDEEKKTADVLKTQFCHQGGDLLSMLNVFRVWHKVSEKEKGKWCKDNSINGKAIKGVREAVNEVLTVLRREMKEDIKFELLPSEDTDGILQALIIGCLKKNVCCFLGHEQAGYITAKQLQNVQIHPSSSLKSLGQSPRLLVYWQLLQTSRTFVTNLTPVDEGLLGNVDGSLEIDEVEIARQSVSLIKQFEVGHTVFRTFVGPMHKNRREKEAEIKEVCNNSIVVIDAKRELGEVQLFCNKMYSETAKTILEMEIQSLKEPLKKETSEIHLGKTKAESGTRAVIGNGAAVQDILMPDEYRTVKIKLDDNGTDMNISEADMSNTLSVFGEITELFKFKRKTDTSGIFWGKVTFQTHQTAKNAVQFYKERNENDISLIPITFGSGMTTKGTKFTLKLTWLRRSSKGFGYVNLDRPEDLSAILSRTTVLVDGSCVNVSIAKRGNLYLKGLAGDVTEEAICEALANIVGVQPDRSRFQVIIPRTDAVGTAENPQLVIKREINKLINVHETAYKVTVREIKPKTVKGMAFVNFAEADDFQYVATHLTQGTPFFLDGNPVVVTVDLKATINISERVYAAVKDDIDVYIMEAKQTFPNTSISMKQLKNGNAIVEICASSTADMATIKVGIHKITDGDLLECERNDAFVKLFTRDARQYLKKVEQELKSVVMVDDRTMSIRVQGTARSKTLTFIKINEYLGMMAESSEKEIALKGNNNPVGFMKALIVQYGADLEKLKSECRLLSINLKHRLHSIILNGDEAAIDSALLKIEEIKVQLSKHPKGASDESLPECPICLCEIELSVLVRLEFCGHSYCQSCLNSQVQSAVKDHQFPIECAAEDCSQPIVLKDIRQQITKGSLSMKPLAAAAVSCFVGKNRESFRFCTTPDCEMVYRVSEDGRQFQCIDCGTRLCTTCHIQFHDGLTCAMYKSAKTGEGNVDMWIRENPGARKKCPKCQIGIEKIEGCNHMTCLACRSHICWVCLKYYSSSGECYGHLQSAHRSFV